MMEPRHRLSGKAKTILQFLSLLMMLWPASLDRFPRSRHRAPGVVAVLAISTALALGSAHRLHQAPIKVATSAAEIGIAAVGFGA